MEQVARSDNISDCSCNAGWSGANVNCQACVSGKYTASPGSAECTDCAAGKYSTTTAVICVYCAAGSYSADNRSECLSCPANSYSVAMSVNITFCVCNAGSVGMHSNCTACVAGKYLPTPKSLECADCGAGEYSRISAVRCLSCSAGSYSADDRSECLSCPANSYSVARSVNITFCVCNAGSVGMHSNCTACVAGKYLPTPKSLECADCGAGEYFNISAVRCVTCAAGLYSADDRSECLFCVNAYSVAGSANITFCVCNAGWMGTDGDCTVCAAGKYKASPGSATCLDCGAGEVAETPPSNCVCMAGFSQTNTICQACVSGKYKPRDGEDTCTNCFLHSQSVQGSDYCVCDAGYSRVNGTCTFCGTTGSVTCRGNCLCSSSGSMASKSYMGRISDEFQTVPSPSDCTWLIFNEAVIYFEFGEFHLDLIQDWVIVDKCETAACTAPLQLAKYSGNVDQNTLTAVGAFESDPVLYPFLRIRLRARGDPIYSGFESYWQSTRVSQKCYCLAGMYMHPRGCLSCPINTYSISGSTSISDCICNAGYTLTNSICTGCVAGKYKPIPGSDACSACENEEYSILAVASTYCALCPGGTKAYIPASDTCIPLPRCSSWVRVTCSGSCQWLPSTSVLSGSITNGPDEYGNNLHCEWLLTSNTVVSMKLDYIITSQFD